MTKRLSPDSVREILERGQFDELLGNVEDEHLDFKSAPYQVGTERGKRDLAQDVAEFAEADGGVIVIGVGTEASEAQHAEVATVLSPFAHDLLLETQYLDVIDHWVLPRPQRVEIRWYPGSGQAANGLGAIFVLPQPEALKPFIVRKALVDDTGKVAGTYVGIFERVRDKTRPRSPDEIQKLLHDGRRFGELDERLDALTEQVTSLNDIIRRLAEGGTPVPPARREGPRIEDAWYRRDQAAKAARIDDQPTLSLIGIPSGAVDIPALLGGSRNPLTELLDHPPELRQAGFDLTVGSVTRIAAGGRLRRAVNPGLGLLELWRDGILIFVAEARGLLCWGTGSESEPFILNPLALAETTYLFADLARRVAQHVEPRPEQVRHVFALQRMEVSGKRSILIAGDRRARHRAFDRDIHRATEPYIQVVIDVAAESDPRVVAYQLRREVYAWFEFDEDAIPYVTEINGQRITDPQQIIRDGQGR